MGGRRSERFGVSARPRAQAEPSPALSEWLCYLVAHADQPLRHLVATIVAATAVVAQVHDLVSLWHLREGHPVYAIVWWKLPRPVMETE